MAIRNRHRVGQHLVQDEDTGFVHYSDEMTRRWDGAVVHKRNMEYRNPQEFVKPPRESVLAQDIRPEAPSTVLVTADLQPLQFIGTTTIPYRNTTGTRTYK